jgi:gliding motility-associated-like protein
MYTLRFKRMNIKVIMFSVLFLFLVNYSFAQCTWQAEFTDSYEYDTQVPWLTTGSCYQQTPSSTYPCVVNGTHGLYLNFVDGYLGIAFRQKINVSCKNYKYRLSFWVKDTWGAHNDCDYVVKTENGTILSQKNVKNGAEWVNVVLPDFIASDDVIYFEIYNNLAFDGGNDLALDQLMLEKCSIPLGLNFNIIQSSCGLSNGQIELTQISNGVQPYNVSVNAQPVSNVLPVLVQNMNSGEFVFQIQDQDACSKKDTLIKLNPSTGISNFITEAEESSCNQENGKIEILSVNGGSAPYSVALNGVPQGSQLSFGNLKSGDYLITVTDQLGCDRTQSITLADNFVDVNPVAPNVFTPNGDGINDDWYIDQLVCLEEYVIQVIDRWGGLVFESKDPQQKWSGIYNDNALADGVYFYHVTGKGYSGKTFDLQGAITLIR